jgi:DNA-binding response OmpR family regulator
MNIPYDLKGVRVLVVEDFPFMAQLMSAMLREFNVGFVLSVCDVTDAKRIIEEHNGSGADPMNAIDLLLTDLFPPRNEGLDLVKWIREHNNDSIHFLPTLLCSALTTQHAVESGRDLGANEIMVKPVSAEKLAQRILYVIDHPRAFIKAPGFFGPDRRRKKTPYHGTERRVMPADAIKVVKE